MAEIKPRRGTSAPSTGLSQYELAVDTTKVPPLAVPIPTFSSMTEEILVEIPVLPLTRPQTPLRLLAILQ